MQSIKEIYYGADSPSYFQEASGLQKKTVLFERLRVTTDNNGHVYVNGETGRIDEIVPPMPIPATKKSTFPSISSKLSGPVELK